jgi:hypothetical protein
MISMDMGNPPVGHIARSERGRTWKAYCIRTGRQPMGFGVAPPKTTTSYLPCDLLRFGLLTKIDCRIVRRHHLSNLIICWWRKTMTRRESGPMDLTTAGTIILVVATAYSAWLTSIVFCASNGMRPLLIAGAAFFPVGIVHGIGVWFGGW